MCPEDAPEFDGRFVTGRIAAANDSMFVQANFSEPLTAFASGFRDPNNIEETLNFFAPPVQTARRFEYAQFVNIEEFFSDGDLDDDLRAPRADFKKVEYKSEKVNGKTENRGLCIDIDMDEVGDIDLALEDATAKLIRRSHRNDLRRVIALLSAAAVNAAKTWDTTAGKDPDQDVIAEQVAAATASGLGFNRVGYGHTAWSKRALAHRAQNSAGGFASAGLTAEQLAGLLNVDKVHVSRERFQDTASAKAEIIGNLVLMFFALDGVSTEDASNIKRFWSPTEGGGMFRVYQQQISAKLVRVTVERYVKPVITSTLGIRKFTVS
jgi:hypothetical protein